MDRWLANSKRLKTQEVSKMKIIRGLLLVVAPLVLASCAALRAAPEPPRQRPQAQKDPEYLVDKEKLDKYAAITDSVEKKLFRNEIIDERLLEVDNQFEKYEIALWQQGVGAGIGTDWVQLAVSGATATAGGATTKSVLGAVNAFITGAKASFDKNAFFEKTLAAVVAQMVGEREKMRTTIAVHKQLPVSDYTLFEALADVKKFMMAGTIPGAIQGIATDAGAKAAKATEELKQLRVGTFVRDDASNKLRAFIMPDGNNIDKANEERLTKWMEKNGLATSPGNITMFIRSKEMADLRLRAVKELLP
jgi:hypothetical protein